jgi:hypothetical protein
MIEPTDYRWTPVVQRRYIEALAETGSITRACAAVGKSRVAAYGLRHRNDGLAFRLGWDAAILIARTQLSDSLIERAIWGQEDVVTKSTEGTVISISRQRHDNRLGAAQLSRLDRMVKRDNFEDIEAVMARVISSDFELFLDMIEAGGGVVQTAQFIDDHRDMLGLFAPPEIPAAAEPNEHCKLAEENDMQHPPEIAYLDRDPEENVAKMDVWYNEDEGCWYTSFPPPNDLIGEEHGEFGEEGYQRHLSEAEERIQHAFQFEGVEPLREAAVKAWARYFDLPETAFFKSCDGEDGEESLVEAA